MGILMKNEDALDSAVFITPTKDKFLITPKGKHKQQQTFFAMKRAIDILASTALLLFFAPLIGAFALMVRLDGHRAFYGQVRLGKNGLPFRMWKLRSMVPDADARLARHIAANPAAKEEWDNNQKLLCDPRVTAIGRLLRKYSLDELPQLFNVLSGEMSLIGPRPMMCGQQSGYPGELYAGLRPGLTGLWQVSRRDDQTFAARARFDLEYAQNLSIANEGRIVLLTLVYLFKGRGC
jgi:exopolysaccharide production protein ExoY